MLSGVSPAWQIKKNLVALALLLPAMVLSAPALANDDRAKVVESLVEQSSIAVPLPERRPADAQASLTPVSDARRVSGNRSVRVASSRRRVRAASTRRRSCTYLGCRGHTIVGVGF
jgi:hypothetical protein